MERYFAGFEDEEETGPWPEKCGQPLVAGEDKMTDSSLELQKATQLNGTMILERRVSSG